MHDFWLSLVMVFIAELGDKTQLVSLSLATRYSARVVLAGITVATLLVHVFSALIGNMAGALMPRDWLHFLSGLAFIGFGLWTLRGDSLDGEESVNTRRLSPFFLVAVVFFFAELGDKTMLCTVTMAGTCAFAPVWLGSTAGMVLADGLAIWAGCSLGARLQGKTIKVGAALIFFAFGLVGSVKGGMNLPPLAWLLGLFPAAGAIWLLFEKREPPKLPPVCRPDVERTP